jgi:hypothetical protein
MSPGARAARRWAGQPQRVQTVITVAVMAERYEALYANAYSKWQR